MAKKKKSLGDQTDIINTTSVNGDGNISITDACPHMRQSVNVGNLKKSLKDLSKFGKCQKCDKDAAGETSIYVCLQCGHQGCDRSSSHQHALKHFESCKSHSCAMNIENQQIWCYKCDDFKTSDLKVVQDCSDVIFKLFKKGNEDVTVKINDDSLKSEKSQTLTPSSDSSANLNKLPRVKGLSNLGNTCFFNSIMQCINQTYLFEMHLKARENSEIELNCYLPIEEFYEEDSEESIKKKSIVVKLGQSIGITKSLLLFYENMKCQDKKAGVFSPGALFGSICSKAPQFQGFQQQDSHEVLRHLLDGIREEEIKKLQSGILSALNVTKEDKNCLSDNKKKMIKDLGKSAKHTTADEVFGGCFLSTVTCEECHTPHQIYESFLDISLPILVDRFNDDERDSQPHESKSQKTHERKVYNNKNASEDKVVSKHMTKKERKNAKKLMKHQNKKNKPQKLTLGEFNEMQEKSAPPLGGDDDDDDDALDAADDVNNEGKEDKDHKEEEEEEKEEAEEKEEGESDLIEGTNGMNLIGGKSDEVHANDWCRPVEDSSCRALSNGHLEEGNNSNSDDDKEDDDNDGSKHKDDRDVPFIDSNSNEAIEDASMHCYEDYISEEGYDYTSLEERKLQAKILALTPLGSRHFQEGCSISTCLYQFTSPEFLLDSNKYLCDHCNRKSKGSKNLKYTVARRQVLIYAPPAVLTLHLKRFQQTSTFFKKLNTHVSFAEVLDIGPYCSSLSQNISAGQTKVLYSLYGVVEHSGSMKGGHYTAYVKVREENRTSKKFLQSLSHGNFSPELLVQSMMERRRGDQSHQSVSCDQADLQAGKWYYISDSHVSEVKDISNVLRCQAYILFYERIL